MDIKQVKYVCVSGEIIDWDDAYLMGEEVEGIGAVQAIIYPCVLCGEFDCDWEEKYTG